MGVHQQNDKQPHHQQELQTAVQAAQLEGQESQHGGDGLEQGFFRDGEARGEEMIVRGA